MKALVHISIEKVPHGRQALGEAGQSGATSFSFGREPVGQSSIEHAHYRDVVANHDPEVRSYHELPRVQHLHRALGGYVEMYSQGVAAMRHGIEQFLAPLDDDWSSRSDPLLHILFAGMTAKPIADAFFGMAAAAAKLGPDEIVVRNVLRREWEAHTVFRNDLAHAEWSVGWANAETGEPVPPASIRIKNVDGTPVLTNLAIDTNGIVEEINTLIPLVRKVRIFAQACRERQRTKTSTILSKFDVIDSVSGEPRRVNLRDS